MTTDIRRHGALGRLLAATLVAMLVPATAAGQSPRPMGPFEDIVQYRVDDARSNVQPGAAPVETPSLVWQAMLPDAVAFPPIIVAGRLLAADASGGFHAMDPATGAELWSIELAASPVSAVAVGGTISVMDTDGTLHGIDPATGDESWAVEAGPDGELAGLAVGAGRLISGTGDGRIRELDPATGQEIGAAEAPGPIASLTMVGPVAYIATSDAQTGAVDLGDDEDKWPPVRLLSGLPSSIGVVDGTVFVASRQPPGESAGELLAIEAETGVVIWRFRAPSGRQVVPGAVADGVVYASSTNDGLYAFDVTSGDIRWHVPDAPPSGSPPALAGDLVLTVSERLLNAYRATDGSLAWQAPIPGAESGSPVASGGLVFVGDLSGAVSAFGPGAAVTSVQPSLTAGPAASAEPPAALLTLRATWDREGIPDLDQPCSGDVSPSGDLVIPNCSTGEILVIDPDGKVKLRFGGTGTKDGQLRFQRDPADPFSAIGGAAVAPDGTIYVADTVNRRIQHFTADGAFLAAFGSYGQQDGQFQEPIDVAVGPDGTVYVVDDVRDDIQRFTAEGEYLQTIGSHGSGDGQLLFTAGIDVAPDGTLANADWDNERVQAWTADGEFLWTVGRRGVEPGGFRKPCDVAMASDGHLIVAEADGMRLQVFGPDGTPLAEWAAPVPLCGVSVTPSGTVYAAAPFDDRIFVLELAPAS